MTVESHEAEAVVNENRIAVNAEIAGQHHDAIIGRRCRGVAGGRQIIAQMGLAIDFPALIAIGPGIGKAGHDLAILQRGKRFAPKKLRA